MQIGMKLHRVAPPRPPAPRFRRVVKTTVSPIQGEIPIYFYVPKDWEKRKVANAARFPIVVNFHGGGFTLGSATDDARWATCVAKHVDAVVASVDYRLAPEFAFPTAVQDGVDAVFYVARNADDLHIDVNKIAHSGFSSGGNMTFTVPMRLQSQVIPDSNDSAKEQES